MKIFCVLIILLAITVMMYLSRKVSYFIHAPQKVQPSFEYENLRWSLLMDVKELGNVDSSGFSLYIFLTINPSQDINTGLPGIR